MPDTKEKLFNDMDDRIKELERQLNYAAQMLLHACDLIQDGSNKRALTDVASKSIAMLADHNDTGER